MKIACLISSLRLGGAERQLASMAAALGRAGHEVEVITYRDGDFYDELLSSAGIRRHRIKAAGDSGIISELAEHLRSCGSEVLISYLTGANVKACLAKRVFPDFKLIVSERNFNIRLLPHDSFRLLLYRRYADRVVCNCHAQEELLRKRCPSLRQKLCTITNCVDFSVFNPGQREKSCHRQPVITVTARVCRRKNTLGLIRAADILRKKGCTFRIEWYGADREDAYSRKCRALIKEAGLEGSFILNGASPSVAGIYRKSDFFCLPSLYEGTSNSLAEALSCGLPCICSRVSDNPLYVKEGANGFLFDPSSPDSIAEAICKALDMSAVQRESSSRESLVTALRSFSSERLAEEYDSLMD